MTSPFYRRLIAWVAVLCQVLTVGAAHVPMAVAMSAPATVAAVSPHCHEHAQGAAHSADSVMQTAPVIETTKAQDLPSGQQTHHCKTGACSCSCAHVSAAPPGLHFETADVCHPPLISSYRVPSPPHPATPFFRPPI